MKNSIVPIVQRTRILLLSVLLFGQSQVAIGQFQTTVGFPDPSAERSPGGIVTPSGFLVFGSNDHHPNAINGLPDGDLQLTWLNNSGNISQPSKMLGTFPFDHAAWIEKVVCSGTDHYLLASSSGKIMLLTLTDLAGIPVWSRSIGSVTGNNILTSACVKMDANGSIIIVGTQQDPNTGVNAIVAVKTDCNGNQIWSKVYSLNGYSSTVTSVSTFAASPGGGNYYITGKAAPIAGGNEEVFLLQLNDLTGNFGFMKRYDVTPNSDDVGTCIQGSVAPAPNGGIWISGYSDDINGLKNVLMMRLDLSGNVQWAKNYDIPPGTGDPSGDELANHFQLTTNGKLVITGRAEEYTAFQGTKAGNCMLMRMDIFGNTVDWARVYTSNQFSSMGNRVEVTANDEYFVTGESLELLSPSQSANNVLALLTDQQGQTGSNCYHDVQTQVIPRMPVVVGVSPASITFSIPPDFNQTSLGTLSYNDQQSYCPAPPPCDCDFTWTNTTCFDGYFTVTCTPAYLGNYTYLWDHDCDPNTPPVTSSGSNTDPNATSFVQTFPYTFPCGGGTFTVCLTVIDPFGTSCFITHTITVPSECCGSVSGSMVCHPTDPYKYDFTINVTNPPGSTGCNHVLTSPYALSNLVYSPTTITGSIVIPDPIPTAASFTLNTNCTCITTGLPITCTLPFTLPTVCCKQICVDDQTVCDGLDEYLVPFYACNWPPVNNVYQVSWYVMPKPASGICPSVPWGGQPYQSTVVNGTLQPLLLFPDILPGDLCVYVVIDLNDGPCTQITSNIATVQLCKPNSCTLDDQEFCYFGNPIMPGLITLSYTGTAPTCINTIEWFDENGAPAPAGNPINTYQPTNGLVLPPGFTDCYKDFFYTAILTDGCGPHECKARVRLYNYDAPIGTLTMSPNKQQPLCWAEDVTLKFEPECAGDPAQWLWYKWDCNNNLILMQEAGLMNKCLNLNELYEGGKFGVAAVNGVCPVNTEEMDIDVLDRAVLASFSAIADPCAEQQVVLSASIIPGLITCSGQPFSCTYTYEWYKDGNLIGTTLNGTASESFTYLNPNLGPPPKTMGGNYYAVIREDCCPRNVINTGHETIRPACEQCIMGPCFICDNKPETFSVIMVLPPNEPCPDVCTFTWYDAIESGGNWVMNNPIGTGSSVSISSGGHYFLVSDCNDCMKKTQFDVLACDSGKQTGQTNCGPVSVEEILSKEESPLHVFPNPTTGEITIQWSENAPKNARVFITDAMGQRLKTLLVPGESTSLTTSLEDMPSGLYFIKVQSSDRWYNVAKLVKE